MDGSSLSFSTRVDSQLSDAFLSALSTSRNSFFPFHPPRKRGMELAKRLLLHTRLIQRFIVRKSAWSVHRESSSVVIYLLIL